MRLQKSTSATRREALGPMDGPLPESRFPRDPVLETRGSSANTRSAHGQSGRGFPDQSSRTGYASSGRGPASHGDRSGYPHNARNASDQSARTGRDHINAGHREDGQRPPSRSPTPPPSRDSRPSPSTPASPQQPPAYNTRQHAHRTQTSSMSPITPADHEPFLCLIHSDAPCASCSMHNNVVFLPTLLDELQRTRYNWDLDLQQATSDAHAMDISTQHRQARLELLRAHFPHFS